MRYLSSLLRNGGLRRRIVPSYCAGNPSLSARFSSHTEQRVTLSVDADGIAHVQLNRSDKLNALDLPMFEALRSVGQELQSKPQIRVVILSGKGRAFCTGLDVQSILRNNPLQSMERLLERRNDEVANLAQMVAYQWRQLPVPVVAVLHGMCFGGGLQIALGADFRYCTPECQLSIMETKWGLIPDMSMTVTLRELVRIDVAKELTMTGRIVKGEEAAALGLVTRCVEDPHHEAKTLARTLLEKSPDAVALTKQLYQQTWVDCSESDALLLETKLQRRLLKSWNQMAATGRVFGVNVPYWNRKETKEGEVKK
jgi:enoyl-CoA hydratase/carnithine racemase